MGAPSFLPSFTEGNFAPESISIPQDPKEFPYFLKNTLEFYARLINRKDTGQYETFELQNNQTFPGSDPQAKRMVFRTIVDCGALPNTATKTVAHGLANYANIVFTRIYGTSTNPNALGIPLPYVNLVSLATSVQIAVDPTNIILVTGSDFSAFTSTYVVIEYYRT